MAITLKELNARIQDPLIKGMTEHFWSGSQSVVLPELYFINESNLLLAIEYQRRDALGGVGARNLNEDYTASEGVTSPQRETLGIFGGSAEVDVLTYDGTPSVLDDELAGKVIASGKYFDRQFVLGDNSTNPKEFNGLRRRSVLRNQILWAGTNGGALTLDLLDEALDSVPGDNSLKRIYCDAWMRRKISALQKSGAGGKGVQDTAYQATEYNGAPIRILAQDHQYKAIFNFTETRGTSAVTSSLYVVRLGGATDKQGVQGIPGKVWMKTQVPARSGSKVQSQVDTIAGICDFEPNCFVRLGGILKS